MTERWQGYYQSTEGKPPRPTLLDALQQWRNSGHHEPGYALDLGAGTGRDTMALLQEGWRVRAYDGEAKALSQLQKKAQPLIDASPLSPQLETQAAFFEEIDSLPACDLVNASFSLPFCQPSAFAGLWLKLTQALRPGGLFCGQLLGPQDQWIAENGLLSFSNEELERLVEGYRVIEKREEIGPGNSYKGEKFWHIWHLVLERKP